MSNARPTNDDDTIEGSAIHNRLEELRDERRALQDDVYEAQDHAIHDPDSDVNYSPALERATARLAGWDDDNADELRALEGLENEVSKDDTLIRDSEFNSYAREQAEDIHGANWFSAWPFNCVDWDQAATELKHDYGCAVFDGVTYWVRS